MKGVDWLRKVVKSDGLSKILTVSSKPATSKIIDALQQIKIAERRKAAGK
jgi:hypothetical protein